MKEDPPFFTKVFFDSYIGTHAIVLIVNLTSQWHTVNCFGTHLKIFASFQHRKWLEQLDLWNSSKIPLEFQQFIILILHKLHL